MNSLVLSHSHWCHLGKHFIYNCSCALELPMNQACTKCVLEQDKKKDLAVEEALQKIIDVDPQHP